ncbi:hypothetical protein [Chitinophaga sancti]|uniref:Uncharacterized protein n=1 Tax=Chitinophaga sancti TaxID=1004 RepID=A0A1K1LRF1_9BACT|nr:hypothetical protein [Chitinophaga sancti]WQD64904.1 hypothetical protein U0033_10910 [Chitinophaga sancti]WQG89472.1 hypothetical protein SR876_31560 [Chitinophaga sancti]SFW13452.1 hypothetical protein SAMN05661012_00158 [Chitinophaga sancti]
MELAAILQQVPDYKRVYHDTVIPQHLQYYFINRQHDLKAAFNRDKAAYLSLNTASYRLSVFLKEMLNRVQPDITFKTAADVSMGEWGHSFETGRVYESFLHAEKVCSLFQEHGYAVHEWIVEKKELAAGFINISYWVKAAFQFEILIAIDHLCTFVANSISFLADQPHLAYYIKEMTIGTKEQYYGGTVFKAIKIRLIPEVVCSKRNPVVKEISEAVLAWQQQSHEQVVAQRPYAMKVGDNVSISQGNFNYKHFLSLLGILNKVYDDTYDYAYLLNT